MPALARIVLALFILATTCCNESVTSNDTIAGKVVAVADGDTITVLENGTHYRIRLFGIDPPERRQDFGTRARRFASGLVFGKQVRVIKQDVDRYAVESSGSSMWAMCASMTRWSEEDWSGSTGTIAGFQCVEVGWHWNLRPGEARWDYGRIGIRCRLGGIGGTGDNLLPFFEQTLDLSNRRS